MIRSCIYQAFEMVFVVHYFSLPCAPVRYCSLLGFVVHSCAFTMNLNRPLSDIICQSHVIMCISCGLEYAFVGYSTIPCVINGPNRPLSDIHLSCEYAMSKLPCVYWEFVIASNIT